MAELCHFYPGYTVGRLMETPVAVIRELLDQIPTLLKYRGL